MVQAAEIVSQILVIILIAHASVYSYKVARWTCARSVQWLTAGFIYILAWRIMFFFVHVFGLYPKLWVEDNQTYFIIPAYAMWAWGMYLLYKTLMNLGRKHD